MFKKILSALAVAASLFSTQAKAVTTIESEGNKNDAGYVSPEVMKQKTFKDIARQIGGAYVSTNGGVYPMKRKNQRQYRKHVRQNQSSKRSKKHRSRN